MTGVEILIVLLIAMFGSAMFVVIEKATRLTPIVLAAIILALLLIVVLFTGQTFEVGS